MDKNSHNPGLDKKIFINLYINLSIIIGDFSQKKNKSAKLDVMDITIKIMTLADKYTSPVLYMQS